jgi:hypothetical protein
MMVSHCCRRKQFSGSHFGSMSRTSLRGRCFAVRSGRALRIDRLTLHQIRRLGKRAARAAGVKTPIARKLSGHSMCVGAAQYRLVAGFDATATMQAGGWRSTNVLQRPDGNAETLTRTRSDGTPWPDCARQLIRGTCPRLVPATWLSRNRIGALAADRCILKTLRLTVWVGAETELRRATRLPN